MGLYKYFNLFGKLRKLRLRYKMHETLVMINFREELAKGITIKNDDDENELRILLLKHIIKALKVDIYLMKNVRYLLSRRELLGKETVKILEELNAFYKKDFPVQEKKAKRPLYH
jgi:hypothetical protein